MAPLASLFAFDLLSFREAFVVLFAVLDHMGTRALSRITALLMAALAVSFVREGTVSVANSLR